MYKLRQFIRSIKNLVKWFPIIWKDRDWDDYYIWGVLKFKLKNQAEYIGGNDRYVGAKRDAEIMMLCVRLIDKLQEEYYTMEYQDYREADFNFIPSSYKPEYFELDIVEKSENLDDYFKKYPRIYKTVINADKMPFTRDSKVSIALNIAHINHNRARKLLFKLLERNIEGWWD